jgi:hypothetical protein
MPFDSPIGAGRLSTAKTAHLGTLLGPIRYLRIGPVLIAVRVLKRSWTKDDLENVPRLAEPLADALVANPDWHLRSAASLLAVDPEADLTGSYFDRNIGRQPYVRDYITDGTGAVIRYTNKSQAVGETKTLTRGLLFEVLIPEGIYYEPSAAAATDGEDPTADITGRTVQFRESSNLWHITEGAGDPVELSDIVPDYFTNERRDGRPERKVVAYRSELVNGKGESFA